VKRLAPNAPPSTRLFLGENPEDFVPTVFGVGPNSAFMSPYWHAQFVVPKDPDAIGFDTAKDVSEVLAVQGETFDGPPVGCPILPEGVTFTGARGLRPLSLEPVKPMTPAFNDGIRTAWVDKQIVKYVDLGPGTFQLNDEGEAQPTSIYFFVTGDVDKPTRLALPAVLAADTPRTGFANRVHVWLNGPDTEVFVPAGWDAVRQELKDAGLVVLTPSASIAPDVEKKLRLRVARRAPNMAPTASCFEDAAALPGPCTWLDSEAALHASLEGRQFFDTNTRQTVWTVLFNGAFP
jgi:hypothetical protein